MLISKFDLYKSEWLDLVFDDRNKEYGAYDLRKHYAGNVVRAMGITFFGVSVLFGAYFVLRTTPHFVHITTVINDPNLIHVAKPPVVPIKAVPPAPVHQPKPDLPSKPVATIKDPVMVVKPDIEAQNPVKNEALVNSTIGPVTTPGKGDGGNALPSGEPGPAAPSAPDNTIYNTSGVDVMPTPVGGEAAWAKFLNKNLRFPAEAQDAGVGGRVILSFVIEKDGSLSNITVNRKAGYGFDEEALRVLRMAKAWVPGKQNGQPVRVMYMIPINFQVADPN